MSLAYNIRIQRKQAGLTQIELAERLGISIATLRRWESGETSPSGTRIMEMANIFGISPDGLLSNEEGAENGRMSVLYPAHERSGGMLVFEGEGTRIELPPTEKGYEVFQKLIDNMMKRRGLYKTKEEIEAMPEFIPRPKN